MENDHSQRDGSAERIDITKAVFPKTISVDVDGVDIFFDHASDVLVGGDPNFGGIYLGLFRMGDFGGLFMGWTPDVARRIGEWLIRESDRVLKGAN